MLQPGARFAGYRIVRRIGAGGMGVVYLAEHPRLPRQDVLKLLPADHLADAGFRGRFDREAELAARLRHPNIVTVHDRGVTGGQPWIAMEYVPGTDAAALAGSPQLGPRRAAHIIDDAARGLDHAHRNGMLHRDVKPANILVTADPDREFGERALLTDFGIARLAREGTDLTRTGDVIATVSYAAPEQFTAGPVDHRADVYALGCTLFVLLTGEKLFPVSSTAAVVNAHLNAAPPAASDRAPGLPPAIDAVLYRALSKNPADRYDSCRAFSEEALRALESALGGPPTPVRPDLPHSPGPRTHTSARSRHSGGPHHDSPPPGWPTPTRSVTSSDSASSAASAAGTGQRRVRKRPLVAGAGALLLAAALTTTAVFGTDNAGSEGASDPTAAPVSDTGAPVSSVPGTATGTTPAGDGYAEARTEVRGDNGDVSWNVLIPQVNGGTAAVADRFNNSVRAALQDQIDNAPASSKLTSGPPNQLHIGAGVLSALLTTARTSDPPSGEPKKLLATITINAENADPITLRDLFPDLDAGLNRLSDEAERLLPETAAGPDFYHRATRPRTENFHHWVATDKGMAIHFEEGSVAPPGKGLITVTVPWRALADVLDPALAEVLRG